MTANSFVDSNVIIYSYERDPKSSQAQELVQSLADRNVLVVSPQVVAETYTNLSRVMGSQVARPLIDELIGAVNLWPLDARTVELAFAIHDHYGYSYWDCQILAAAKLSGAAYLLTEDLQDGQTVEGVTIIDPFSPCFDINELLELRSTE